ncbi:MAG: hypothetical protein ACTSRI_16605 [Promethearchaeota archaeon]
MIENKTKEKKKKNGEDKEKIVEHLSLMSSKLKEINDFNKKIHILMEFNDYLKENGDMIEKVCPEKLISILNSL